MVFICNILGLFFSIYFQIDESNSLIFDEQKVAIQDRFRPFLVDCYLLSRTSLFFFS